MWVCVSSADDCRLRDHGLRLRVIVQNVDCGVTRILKEGICLVLVDGRVIRVGASGGGVHAKLFEWSVERAGSGDEMAVLRKDDFVTIGIYVSMPGAVFEVDALERLHEVRVPITGDATEICAATFVETEIWEAYDLLPGGWWARRS